MIFKIDLLDALSIQADCTYLSDLHHLNDWQRTRLVRALEQTPSDAAELREWNDALEYFTGARPCPGENDLASQRPDLAAQWHPTLNGSLTAEQVTAGSHRKIWWQCPEGHVWKAVIYSRAGPQKTGCPVCAGTVRRRRAPVPLTSDQIAGHRV